MSQHYSEPGREADPYSLPDLETFQGFQHACRDCGREEPLFPDYYGLLYPDAARCPACDHIGMRCVDTKAGWYWWACFPGCMPDGEPMGPFETEAEALEDARSGMDSD